MFEVTDSINSLLHQVPSVGLSINNAVVLL